MQLAVIGNIEDKAFVGLGRSNKVQTEEFIFKDKELICKAEEGMVPLLITLALPLYFSSGELLYQVVITCNATSLDRKLIGAN